jgi:hypothetical protein
MRNGKVKLVCAGVVAGLWLAGVAEGSAVGISYVAQNRSVSASSSATGLIRGGTSDAPVTENQDQSQQANGFGGFAGSVSASTNLGPQSAQASASATQNSTLGPTSFSASGAVRADSFSEFNGPVQGSASTVFHITFDVAQTETYAFSASLNSSSDFEIPTSDSVKIELTNSSGSNLFAPITSINLSNFQVNGLLAPGTYVLALDIAATSADQSDNFVNYNVSLVDGPVNGVTNLPTAPSPVPLPSALTDSLAMLAGLGIVGLAKNRIARWVRGSIM